MNIRTLQRRNPIVWLLVCAVLGITPLACAQDRDELLDIPLVRDLVEGEMQLFKVGHNASLHMGLKSSNRETGAAYSSPVANNLVNEHGLRLSYRLNW